MRSKSVWLMSGAAPPTRRQAGPLPPLLDSRSDGEGRRRRSRSRPRRARGACRRRRSVSAPALDEARLARAGLVHRRVAGAARAGARLDGVAGDLGALAGQRRGEDLPAVAVGAAGAALAGRTTLTVPPSSRRSSWESRSSSPAAMRPAIVSVGLVSPRSTCESIGAETPERSARSRSERSIDSRSARTRDPTGVPTSIRAYVIAYKDRSVVSGGRGANVNGGGWGGGFAPSWR